MIVWSLPFLLLLAIGSLVLADTGQPPALLSERGSERSTTGPGNNIVTCGGKTHVVWQDSDANGYFDSIRTCDRATGTWSEPVRIGPAKDNHARPCIAVDSTGVLHVVIGGHGTMMSYYRSLSPNDASAWTKAEPVAIGTYPMLVCGPDDTLVLAAREDTGVRGLNVFVKKAGGPWVKRDRVFRRKPLNYGYAGYNVALAWGPDGRLHLAADVYESGRLTPQRGLYQAVVYMVTDDLGLTWKRASGAPIPTNATPDQLDVIAEVDAGPNARNPPMALRNGGLAVDAGNRPFVYFMHITNGVARARLVTTDGTSGWRDLPLDEAFHKRWPDMTPAGARGSLSLTPDGALHVLFMLAAGRPATGDADAGEEGDSGTNFGIGLLTSRDGGLTYEGRDVLARTPSRMVNLGNVERQTGHNDLAGRLPSVLWMDGLQRYPAKGEVINTKVFWLQPE